MNSWGPEIPVLTELGSGYIYGLYLYSLDNSIDIPDQFILPHP